jgi:hypothetical protein
MGSGEPPTCAVPLFSPAAKIHPSVALSNDKEFRPLRRATADRGGSDELLKKLEQNFQTDNARQPDKSKFIENFIRMCYQCQHFSVY